MSSQAPRRNVFLIGPMGSGKTAVGKQLARLLDLTFYDSDVEIERRTGVDIPYIFEKEGERLCLINTEVIMFRDGKIIFSGSDEKLRSSGDPYIQRFIHGK